MGIGVVGGVKLLSPSKTFHLANTERSTFLFSTTAITRGLRLLLSAWEPGYVANPGAR